MNRIRFDFKFSSYRESFLNFCFSSFSHLIKYYHRNTQKIFLFYDFFQFFS